jgi:hypothetical protein
MSTNSSSSSNSWDTSSSSSGSTTLVGRNTPSNQGSSGSHTHVETTPSFNNLPDLSISTSGETVAVLAQAIHIQTAARKAAEEANRQR